MNLIPNTAGSAASGDTGLIGLTGEVSGNSVTLFATTEPLNDLGNTAVVEITDALNATSDPGETFSTVLTASPDENIRGISFAPTENTTPCYCPGTLIATEHGDVPVEDLAIGDKVMTKSGDARPIKWIGRRSYGGRFVMGRKDILPVCIKAGALDDNVPRRDLWISPHHAMYPSRRRADRGQGPRQRRLDRAGRTGREGRVFPYRAGQPRRDHRRGRAVGELHRRRQPRYVPQRARIPSALSGGRGRACALLRAAPSTTATRSKRRGGASRCAPGLQQPRSDEPRVGTLRGQVDRITARRIEGWAQNRRPSRSAGVPRHLRRRPTDRSSPGQHLSRRPRTRRPSAAAATALRSRRRRGSSLRPTLWKCAARSTAPCSRVEIESNAHGRVEQSSNRPSASRPSSLTPAARLTVSRRCFQDAGLRYTAADAIVDTFADSETGTSDSAETILHAEG